MELHHTKKQMKLLTAWGNTHELGENIFGDEWDTCINIQNTKGTQITQ
jgi:hypothetical protein